MKRFIFEGEHVCVHNHAIIQPTDVSFDQSFLNRFADEVKPGEFEIAADDVYNIEILVSTGAGKLHDADVRTTGLAGDEFACICHHPGSLVFRRNLLSKFQLKSKSGRAVFAEITERYPTMPFCSRTLDSANTRLAVKVDDCPFSKPSSFFFCFPNLNSRA